jgi:glycosyltransferase involved in cell wall biosynthesis
MGTPCVVTESTSAADAYLERPARDGVQIALPVARPHQEGLRRYYGVDVASLARQLAAVLGDDQLALRLSQDGRDYVRKRYTHRQMGDGYLALYDRLLGAEGRAQPSRGTGPIARKVGRP